MNKKNIGFLILFIESILLFIATSIGVLRLTILDKNYILKKMNSLNFYSKQYEEIKKEMSYYTNQSGFEDDILDDIFTIKDVKKDVTKVIENTYQNRKTTIDTTKIRERFKTKIDQFIIDNNYQEVNEEELNNFILKMESIYSDENKFMNYVDKITVLPKLKTITTEVSLISILVLIMLVVINKKIFHRKNYSVIFFTSSFLFLFANIYVYNHIDIKHLYLYNDIVAELIKAIANDLQTIGIIIPVVYTIIGLILSIFTKVNHKKES